MAESPPALTIFRLLAEDEHVSFEAFERQVEHDGTSPPGLAASLWVEFLEHAPDSKAMDADAWMRGVRACCAAEAISRLHAAFRVLGQLGAAHSIAGCLGGCDYTGYEHAVVRTLRAAYTLHVGTPPRDADPFKCAAAGAASSAAYASALAAARSAAPAPPSAAFARWASGQIPLLSLALASHVRRWCAATTPRAQHNNNNTHTTTTTTMAGLVRRHAHEKSPPALYSRWVVALLT